MCFHIVQCLKAEFQPLALALLYFPEAGAAADEDVGPSSVPARSLSTAMNVKHYIKVFNITENVFVFLIGG